MSPGVFFFRTSSDRISHRINIVLTSCSLVVRQYIFPLLSKALWSRINTFYNILFSNLKQKKNNIIINRVMGHGSHIYWDTLYIYIYIYIVYHKSEYTPPHFCRYLSISLHGTKLTKWHFVTMKSSLYAAYITELNYFSFKITQNIAIKS